MSEALELVLDVNRELFEETIVGREVRPPLARGHRSFFPPAKGMVAACFIHDANWSSTISLTAANSTPRVDLPIPLGVTGGTGLRSVPRMNISFTWPTNAPDEKHQPPSTP